MNYKDFIKPILDFIFSLIIIIIISPILIVISLVLLISFKGNPFFIQSRTGKNGRIFKIIKFKTMNDKRDKYGNLLPDVMRITRVGNLLRKSSFDELPQLLNVIKGDLSIVGPRPLLNEYLPLYSKEQACRHKVKPGITGWAQVNGRNAITWNQKFEYDLWYVDHISFKLDLKILLLTLKNIFKSEGINSQPNVTMGKFTGN